MTIAELSPRINLEQSRKQAKDLLKAFKAGDQKTLDHLRWNHPRFRGLSDEQIRQRPFALADAQLVIARLHSFDSWPKLLEHIERLRRNDPEVMRFENAADAIVAGDIPALRRMLADHPELIRARSTRQQHAPLIHYITANGIEGYRQISPLNAVEVATILLDAGAEIDAVSDSYGGGWTTLGLVATSTPPRLAGVQIPLMDLLLDRGAAIDGVRPDLTLVAGALANGCPEAAQRLVERGARIDEVVTAASLGLLDLVKRFADKSSKAELEKALVRAAAHGWRNVVEYLLSHGVDVAASHGETALHGAAGRADLEMTRMLIERGAPLEAKNRYGGTVLDGTLWYAYNTGPRDREGRDYPAVMDILLAAGAKADVYPEMKGYIDEIYRRAGRERA